MTETPRSVISTPTYWNVAEHFKSNGLSPLEETATLTCPSEYHRTSRGTWPMRMLGVVADTWQR